MNDDATPAADFRENTLSLIGWVENYNDHLREVIDRCLADNPDPELRRAAKRVRRQTNAIIKAVCRASDSARML